jgi:hypothetical protein
MLREIAEYAQAESWRGEGFLSMEAWLVGRCRMSAARTNQPARPGSQIHPGPTLGGGTGMTPGRQAGAITFRCLTSSGKLA